MTRKGDLEQLQDILDSTSQYILDASEQEIDEIYGELGLDSEEEVRRLESIIRASIASFKLHSLKVAYATSSSAVSKLEKTSIIPDEISAQRGILRDVSSLKGTNQALTLRFRDGDINALSDRDVKSILDDLEELGALK